MVDEVAPRRLSTVLVADVVGFSRLVGEDESGTISALKYRWTSILEPLVGHHNGRVVKYLGDGALIEFASAVHAVQCALSVQEKMKLANESNTSAVQLTLRIGINLGDVIVEGSDILGDDVNIAARLEALSAPGGLCISASVFEAVRGKIDTPAADLGELELKNISRRIRAYRVGLNSDAAAPSTVSSQSENGLTIAVLPFDNMSGVPDHEFIGDGLAENIMTELARFTDVSVIARNSSFVYKGKATRVQDIRRDLGANYILEGSIQKSGERIRVSAQLIDGTNGKHIWAERYDRRMDDLFAVMDEITELIVGTLGAAYGGRLRRAVNENAAAGVKSNRPFDYLVQGLFELNTYTRDSVSRSFPLIARAIELNPRYSKAYAKLAMAHLVALNFGWVDDVDTSRKAAREAAKAALAIDDSEPWAHWAVANCDIFDGQHARALNAMNRALDLNPHDADLTMDMALFCAWAGKAELALTHALKAFRLNPHYPEYYRECLGTIYFENKEYDKAIETLGAVSNLNYPLILLYLAASYAACGRLSEAQATIAQLMADEPDSTIAYWTRPSTAPYANEKELEHFSRNLRLAGLPD